MIASILFFAVQVYAHEGHHQGNHSQKTKQEAAPPSVQDRYSKIQTEYLKTAQPIFAAKCAACHSSDVPAPWYVSVPLVGWLVESERTEAKEHLEISKGFPFSGHGTPEEDLAAIQSSIEKATMPPSFYRLMHPSSSLTTAEKTQLIDWVAQSSDLIAKFKTEEKLK